MFIKSFLLKAVIHKLLVGIGTEYLSMYSKDATEMSEKANTQKTKQNIFLAWKNLFCVLSL